MTQGTDEILFHEGLLPVPLDKDTEPFWEAARQLILRYQVCSACQSVIFFPRRHCPACGMRELEWRESAGRGTVYTFSVVRMSRDPRFMDRVPYAVAWIDLDEGFRMMSNIVGDVDEVSVGMPVELRWAQAGEWMLPVFERASD